MKISGFSIIVILIGFAISTSCGKNCKDVEKRFVDNTIKSFFVFKKGSYWVYKNQDQTKTDSVYVSYYNEDWSILYKPQCWQNQKINMTLKSSSRRLLKTDSVNLIATHVSSIYAVKEFGEVHDRHVDFGNASPVLMSGIIEFYNDVNLKFLAESPRRFISSANKKEVLINSRLYEGDIRYFNDTISNTKFYLMANIGMIGWSTPIDTFNLTNFQRIK